MSDWDYDLKVAAEKGDLVAAEKAIQAGAHPATERWGALFGAVRENNSEMVAFLLSQGADVHANSDAPYLHAIDNGYTEIVALFLENGADATWGKSHVLKVAASNGYTKITRMLLEKGADPHVEDDYPLRIAAERGYTDTVTLLLEHAANLDSLNHYALRHAAENKHWDTVSAIVGITGPDKSPLHERYWIEMVDEQVDAFTAMQLPARMAKMYDADGGPSALMQHFVFAKVIHQILQPQHWPDERSRDVAQQLHRALRHSLPESLHILDAVDMTAFQPHSPANGFAAKLAVLERLPTQCR